VVLAWEGNVAAVKADTQDRRVVIAVAGPVEGRRRLLAVIRADFEEIHRSIPKLKVSELLPVPANPGLAVEYENLRVMEAEGISQLPMVYEGRVVQISISGLLNGVDEGGRARAPFSGAHADGAVRVAFSYSHKDEELRDRLEVHLKLLQRQGFVSSWHDRKISPGDKWKDVIDENFRTAGLILLLVSADFIASDYCYETEMKKALERETQRQALVVPIILRACNWEGAPFAHLQLLPKDAKPVTGWQNQDEAWTDVAMGLQRAIENFRSRRV
jgi:internalin A